MAELVDEKTRIIMESFSKVVGKVLTLIEASTPDKQQRQSLKKLLEKTLYDSRNDLIEKLGEPNITKNE